MQKVQTILLTNALDTKLALTNVGASIMSLNLSDCKGNSVNIVAGLKDATSYTKLSYQESKLCLGSTIGRYAGRISNGGFTLDGIHYNLENEANIHLHGGRHGFQNRVWDIQEQTTSKVIF